MGKRTRKIENTVVDATLPKTPLVIDGMTYNLCCDFGALSEAETRINVELAGAKPPGRINLLVAMAEENLANTRILFAAALRPFHPEIAFDDACKLVHHDNVFEVAFGLREAWRASMPETKAHPPGAQPAK
jgi:hypothetical protein